jgi:S-adenosylmethionine decarboxylase
MKFLNKIYHKFNPYGLSMIYLIEENYIAINTWLEYKFIDLEIVTCKEDSIVGYSKIF